MPPVDTGFLNSPWSAALDRETSPPIGLPLLRAELELISDEDGRTIVRDPGSGRQVRLSPAAAAVLRLCDGCSGAAAIARELELDTVAPVDEALARFSEFGLVLGMPDSAQGSVPSAGRRGLGHRICEATAALRLRFGPAAGARPRRVRFRPPATLEFAVVDPTRLLRRVSAITRILGTRSSQAAIWVTTIVGLAAASLSSAAVVGELGRPASPLLAVVVLLVLIGGLALHELAHAASLQHFGGRVRRVGFMLMYGSPALFADVSDAWRLRRGRRVLVALAGVRLNLLAGALAGIAFQVLSAPQLRQAAALVLAGNLLIAVINLCPFVKFDGYLALIGWRDTPHLRSQCMAEAGDVFRRAVFGGRRHSHSSVWRVVYGVLCAVTAPCLVAYALLSDEPVLLLFGRVGGVLVLGIVAVLLAILARRVGSATQAAARAGATRARNAVGLGVTLVGLLVLMMGVRVPLTVTTAYVRAGGSSYIEVPRGLVGSSLRPGTPVELRRAGLMLHPRTGSARTCGPVGRKDVAVTAGMPVVLHTTRTVSVDVVELCDEHGASAPSGLAVVERGQVPVTEWLTKTFVAPALVRLR